MDQHSDWFPLCFQQISRAKNLCIPSTPPLHRHSPSLSSAPTDTCYWIEIYILHDLYPGETTWDLMKIGTSDGNELIAAAPMTLAPTTSTQPPTTGSTWSADIAYLLVKSLCLEEGQYQFTIHDSSGDGICCDYGKGHYNLTSYGEVIVKGGKFEFYEMAVFQIPFVSSLVPLTSPSFLN